MTQAQSRPQYLAATRPRLPIPVRNAALAAAAALTATGRGDIWTLAVAFGVADASALTALVVALVGGATIARTGSAALGDIAGGQAVLGAAGFTGSVIAIGAAWTSAVGLVLAARDHWTGAVLGGFAGTIVAGPSLAGGAKSIGVWTGAVVVGAVAGWFGAASKRRERWQPWVAVGIAAVAAGLGVFAGYR